MLFRRFRFCIAGFAADERHLRPMRGRFDQISHPGKLKVNLNHQWCCCRSFFIGEGGRFLQTNCQRTSAFVLHLCWGCFLRTWNWNLYGMTGPREKVAIGMTHVRSTERSVFRKHGLGSPWTNQRKCTVFLWEATGWVIQGAAMLAARI